jgi:cytochrome c-type biogenesis protein CcmH
MRFSSYVISPVRLILASLFLAMLCGFSVVTFAAVDTFEFSTDEQQQRFRNLSNEFRCPMCQNTSLTGSSGGVAEDLRREIYYMIVDGKTDAEIEQFMFERYGDFIFYRPRFMWQTWLLWLGPLLFLGLGAWLVTGIIRRAKPSARASEALSDSDKERLQKILNKVD